MASTCSSYSRLLYSRFPVVHAATGKSLALALTFHLCLNIGLLSPPKAHLERCAHLRTALHGNVHAPAVSAPPTSEIDRCANSSMWVQRGRKKGSASNNRESWAASEGTWLRERGSHCVVGLMRLCAESGCWVTEMIYGSRMDSRRGGASASPQSCCRGRRARRQSGSHRAGAVSRARVESVEADWRRWAEGYGQVQR